MWCAMAETAGDDDVSDMYYIYKRVECIEGIWIVLTVVALTMQIYLQEETGLTPKWVTRFLSHGFANRCKATDTYAFIIF